jgi:heat shock protein HslJ
MTKKLSFKITEYFMFSVRKTIIFPLIIGILAATSGCNSSNEEVIIDVDNTSNELASFQTAKTKWDSLSGQFYTIQTQNFCFCTTEMSAQMKISVSDDLVLSAVDIDSDEFISKDIQEEIKTVDNLFSLIEKAIADNVSIEVIYNEEFGYPETAKINLEQLAADGGLHITLSNLEVKNSLLALDDVTWILESFDSIAGPQPVLANTRISLSIDMQNMQVNGVDSCNNYTGDLDVDTTNNNMTISNVFRTEIACFEPENVMEQEQRYFATLREIQFFTFDNTTLNMVVGGDAGLNFVAEQHIVDEPKIENPSNDLVLFLSAKDRWDSLSGQYYTIQSQRSCECEDEVAAQMEISVLDNSVLSAIDIVSGEAISTEIQKEIITVDSLFALIEKAIADGIPIEVTYNALYGYPETAKIDLEQLAVDGGLHINLSNLEINDAKFALGEVIWNLESFDSIAGPQPIIENSQISLSLDMVNMQLNGIGGCNHYSADFVLVDEKNNIAISNVVSDQSVCDDPENIMQQEQSYLATLAQVRFFSFGGTTLNMVVGGDSGLHFVIAD